MRFVAKLAATAAATAMVATSAQAGCWSEAEYRAAHVKELEVMLLVESLKCRATPANFIEDYNRFIEVSRPTLTKVNATMKGHFAGEVGARGADNAFDSYLIKVANRYGGASACADMAAITKDAVASGGSHEAIYKVAVTFQAIPTVPGQVCSATTGAAATELVKR